MGFPTLAESRCKLHNRRLAAIRPRAPFKHRRDSVVRIYVYEHYCHGGEFVIDCSFFNADEHARKHGELNGPAVHRS